LEVLVAVDAGWDFVEVDVVVGAPLEGFLDLVCVAGLRGFLDRAFLTGLLVSSFRYMESACARYCAFCRLVILSTFAALASSIAELSGSGSFFMT